jgi:hypothetical protein
LLTIMLLHKCDFPLLLLVREEGVGMMSSFVLQIWENTTNVKLDCLVYCAADFLKWCRTCITIIGLLIFQVGISRFLNIAHIGHCPFCKFVKVREQRFSSHR